MNQEEALSIFKKTEALLTGHFELRSGLHSDQFFQCALVLQYPNYAEQLCKAAVEKIPNEIRQQVDSVISPALGGIPVGHEVGRALGVRAIFAEKQDGKLLMRRFSIQPGEHYVVAEDVVTRGGRVQETIDIVQQCGGVVDAVVVLVDRSAGKADFGIPFFSLVQMSPVTWYPSDCPLCKKGIPVVHPGS